MISQQDVKKLKKAIGFRHIAIINKHLIDNKVLNRYGFPYSNTYISTVFNGHTENKDVEAAIWEIAEQKINEQVQERLRQEEIRKKLTEKSDSDAK